MKKMNQKLYIPLLLLSVALLGFSSAKPFTVNHTVSDLMNQAAKLNQTLAAKDILIVFDADNTLIRSKTNLGSAQWFGWQDDLLQHDKKSSFLVAKDFGDLLRVQGHLFAQIPQLRPERDLHTHVQVLQAKGHPVIVLTARGKEYRGSTLRELKRNEYNFTKSQLGTKKHYGKWKPTTPKGFTAAEHKRFKLLKTRTVEYRDGVMMVAGQHKGAMLRVLMNRTGYTPKAILFMDDTEKNVVAMLEAFSDGKIPVHGYRYSQEDGRVQAFLKGDKQQVHADWLKFQRKHKI